MKSCLPGNGTEMHLALNVGKSVLAERFIRTLKNKNYKHMTAVSKNVYVDKPDEIVDKYNNIHLRIIKMLLDVKSGTYIEYGVEHNDKDPKYNVGDHVKISKYKNFFRRATHQIGVRTSL